MERLSIGDGHGFSRRLACERPGVPITWGRVLERNLEAMNPDPDFVWLETPGKVLHVDERVLEFTEVPPRS